MKKKKVIKKKVIKKAVKPSFPKATASKKAVKRPVKKIIKKTAAKKAKPAVLRAPLGKKIGVVTHYYGNISVGIVKFSKPVSRGAKVHFRGATTDFSQVIDSMQFDHKEIDAASANQEVGMKVKKKVREGDEIYEA